MKKLFLSALLGGTSCCTQAQGPLAESMYNSREAKIIEIRTYNLKPGTRSQFDRLVTRDALPMLQRWKQEVVAYGPSGHDDDSYYVIRAYRDLQHRQQSQDAFYGSEEWKKGPREPILALIVNFTNLVLPIDSLNKNLHRMDTPVTTGSDMQQLSALNKIFISNFVNSDTASHNKIIHPDFVCIEGSGQIVPRDKYMEGWATGYTSSGYTSFGYSDEHIRIFGNMALVRSKTTYTKMQNGKSITGFTIYTDTYVKENGRWLCVQAQITPVK